MSDNEEEEEETKKIIKVVLVGESGVGKTSIINRLINNEFNFDRHMTIGGNYALKKITLPQYDTKMHLEIWDTAGQENYRSFTKIFYKNAKIAILVYDITNLNSFKEIKNYWVKQIKEDCEENLSKIFFIFYSSWNYWKQK
jgi:small GTP-binding protein